MNKHLPKIILIIGIIWLTSSLLYLISIPQWEKSSNKNNTYIQENNKKIEDNKNNTKTEEENINIDNTTIQTDNKLTVLLPSYFFNDAFINLAKDIKEKENIIIKYQTIENLEEYKLFLDWHSKQNITADIFLIPTDRLQWLESNIKKIELEKNTWLSAYFHPIFQYLSSQENYTLVPFSIDPLVTFIWQEVNFNNPKVTPWNILSFLILNKPKRTVDMPLLRWISKNDIRLLENERESFTHYFQILYNFLYQINLNGNIEILEQFQKIYTNDIQYKRDYIKFKEIIKKIEKRNTNCSTFPNICLFAYKFGDIRFWFMSDIIILEKYFNDSNRKENEIKILNFPLADDVYKVRWRVFVINKSNKDDIQTKKFFQYYLKAWVNNSYNLWWKNISAFTNIYNLQTTQKKYNNIIKYEQNFSILYQSIDLQKDFIKKTSTIKFLKWDLSTDEFLNKIKERNR